MIKVSMFLFSLCVFSLPVLAADLTNILAGNNRSEANKSRDVYRHPAETLNFFQVEPGMTVVEIWPGAGWYTEILAPYLGDEGTFYAAHFPQQAAVEYFRKSRSDFEKKITGDQGHYSGVIITEFDPPNGVLAVPPGSADRVLTFRNVHNWLRSNSEQRAFELFYEALKPGGMLGVVEHRARAGVDRQWMLENGYMTEDYVINLAEKAGFKRLTSSEINANPKDTTDHPRGVWTLPPTLRLGDQDREVYLAIGESDRMTLLFIKPK